MKMKTYYEELVLGGGAVLLLFYLAYNKWKHRPRFSATHPGRAVAVGDSLTAHGEYVRQLTANLPGYTWDNHGIVGHSTAAMLNRSVKWAIPSKYGEVLIMGGLNDLSPQRGAEWTIRNLAEMYRRGKAAGQRVVAVTMSPWRGYSRWTEDKQSKEDAINLWIKRYGKKMVDAVVDVYKALEDPQRPGYLNSDYDAGDGLHLNREGQRRLATEIIRQAYQGVR